MVCRLSIPSSVTYIHLTIECTLLLIYSWAAWEGSDSRVCFFLGGGETLDVVIGGFWDGWPGAWGCMDHGLECGLGLVGVMWPHHLLGFGADFLEGVCVGWLGVLLGWAERHVCRCGGTDLSGAMEVWKLKNC